jgi:hypothetical protein
MKTYNDEFKIEVNGEKMQACEILDDLTDYDQMARWRIIKKLGQHC